MVSFRKYETGYGWSGENVCSCIMSKIYKASIFADDLDWLVSKNLINYTERMSIQNFDDRKGKSLVSEIHLVKTGQRR